MGSQMRERVVMHIDMNAFYASVAQHLDPSLRDRPIAVAGDPKKRNGIVLAKSRQAKAAGVKTGCAIWEAKSVCPDIVIVPPDYAAYKKYSRLARMIYYDYTDLVEPFGLDESWIDVTNSLQLFGGDALLLAQEISERVKAELGLTVSVGLSFNKVMAKLGSDIDPGDGIVSITPESLPEVVWPRAASDLIYVGPATARKLHSSGKDTIGDLAHASDFFLKRCFGVIGLMLRDFANGIDGSPVRRFDPAIADVEYDIKGIGNGLTAPHDLECERDAKALVWLLAESVGQRLRESRLRCRTVSVGLRRAGDLSGYSRQRTRKAPTCLTRDIANTAMELILENQPIDPDHALRAIHVRATNLVPVDMPVQCDLFGNVEAIAAQERLEAAIDDLRRRFGNGCVRRVVELTDDAMRNLDIKRDNTVHPIGFLR